MYKLLLKKLCEHPHKHILKNVWIMFSEEKKQLQIICIQLILSQVFTCTLTGHQIHFHLYISKPRNFSYTYTLHVSIFTVINLKNACQEGSACISMAEDLNSTEILHPERCSLTSTSMECSVRVHARIHTHTQSK